MPNTSTIWVVDDNEADLKHFSYVLHRTKILNTPIYFRSANEVLTQLKNTLVLPNIIFLDLHLPKMDGPELLNEIRNIDPHKKIVIVILTGSFGNHYNQKAIDSDADYYLQKPITQESLFGIFKMFSDFSLRIESAKYGRGMK